MLTFKKKHKNSENIAKIDDGRKIYWTHPKYKNEVDNSFEKKDLLTYNFSKFSKNMKSTDHYRFRQALLNDLEGSDEYKKIISDDIHKEIKVDGNCFYNIPKIGRIVTYISGNSGCGKSTLCSKIIKQILRNKPKQRVFLFSLKHEDPVLDSIKKLQRIEIGQDLIDEPIEINEMKNSICIFDDCDDIGNKKLKDAVINLRNLLCNIGRSYDIDVLITTHECCANKATKIPISESHLLIIFPYDMNNYDLEYFLKKKIGVSNELISKIKTLPTTYITIAQKKKVIIYKNGAFVYS